MRQKKKLRCRRNQGCENCNLSQFSDNKQQPVVLGGRICTMLQVVDFKRLKIAVVHDTKLMSRYWKPSVPSYWEICWPGCSLCSGKKKWNSPLLVFRSIAVAKESLLKDTDNINHGQWPWCLVLQHAGKTTFVNVIASGQFNEVRFHFGLFDQRFVLGHDSNSGLQHEEDNEGEGLH